MPELPEVETIRMGFEKYLVGHKVVGVLVWLKKVIKEGDPEKLVGGKIVSARRFGKMLSIDLDNGFSIAAHIKLTGQFIYIGPNRPKEARISQEFVGPLPGKHTHVIFQLNQGGNLYYNDIRRFGWIRIIQTEDIEKLPFVNELGPEPPANYSYKSSGKGETLTFSAFEQILKKSGNKIKVLLMDQKKISGVGNIYANDAIFLARIDPRRIAKTLSFDEVKNLYYAMEEVLRMGIEYGGATESNFVNALGQAGGYQKHFLVYGQEGKSCPGECGGKVEKIRLGGRGTYFCPNCQH